jgi:secreted trypsin-like serine protease
VADGVVGGEPAAPGAWPDAVAILYDGVPGCTGTLVAPDLVLTAGHCAAEASSVVVTHDLAAGGDEIAIEAAIVRPNPLGDLDVAVLRLGRPAGCRCAASCAGACPIASAKVRTW